VEPCYQPGLSADRKFKDPERKLLLHVEHEKGSMILRVGPV